ncbi:hypothetical protein ACQBAR_04525 [Propionibacteriaceae bacterium Y1685]
MTTQQTTRSLGILGALRLAASARAHSLSGLALNVLPRDRDLDRVGDELMYAAQDDQRPESALPAAQLDPATAPRPSRSTVQALHPAGPTISR